MIESCSFGDMVIDGRRHTSDLIIDPDGRVQDGWWRAEGHSLSLDDIAELVAAHPEEIIAGTGSSGMMKIEPGLQAALAAKGIAFHALPTREAATLYNQASGKRKVGACFHLTC